MWWSIRHARWDVGDPSRRGHRRRYRISRTIRSIPCGRFDGPVGTRYDPRVREPGRLVGIPVRRGRRGRSSRRSKGVWRGGWQGRAYTGIDAGRKPCRACLTRSHGSSILRAGRGSRSGARPIACAGVNELDSMRIAALHRVCRTSAGIAYGLDALDRPIRHRPTRPCNLISAERSARATWLLL